MQLKSSAQPEHHLPSAACYSQHRSHSKSPTRHRDDAQYGAAVATGEVSTSVRFQQLQQGYQNQLELPAPDQSTCIPAPVCLIPSIPLEHVPDMMSHLPSPAQPPPLQLMNPVQYDPHQPVMSSAAIHEQSSPFLVPLPEKPPTRLPAPPRVVYHSPSAEMPVHPPVDVTHPLPAPALFHHAFLLPQAHQFTSSSSVSAAVSDSGPTRDRLLYPVQSLSTTTKPTDIYTATTDSAHYLTSTSSASAAFVDNANISPATVKMLSCPDCDYEDDSLPAMQLHRRSQHSAESQGNALPLEDISEQRIPVVERRFKPRGNNHPRTIVYQGRKLLHFEAKKKLKEQSGGKAVDNIHNVTSLSCASAGSAHRLCGQPCHEFRMAETVITSWSMLTNVSMENDNACPTTEKATLSSISDTSGVSLVSTAASVGRGDADQLSLPSLTTTISADVRASVSSVAVVTDSQVDATKYTSFHIR